MTHANEYKHETPEQQFETFLGDLLDKSAEMAEATDLSDTPEVRRVVSFEEAGIMTRNRGLVVLLTNGTKFQVTIIRDRRLP